MSDLLTPQQVAETIGVHEKTVRRMILRGDLPAFRVGRHYRIKADDVPLVPVEPAERVSTPRPRPVREGRPGRFSQLAREMDAA